MPHADRKPVIAITVGDPGGIGPEVVVKALSDAGLRGRARFRVFGPEQALRKAGAAAGIEPFWDGLVIDYAAAGEFPAADSPEGGELSFRLVEDAIGAAMLPAGDARRVDAVVTGPISKRAWAMAGHGEFPGHTELLAARTGAKTFGMMFVGPRLRVILATTHVPLMEVRRYLTAERVLETIRLGHGGCTRLGLAAPRIAVCGLNPHAGEGGLLGDEEAGIIAPAVARAGTEGIDAAGPYPADTVFHAAAGGKFDLVVAMYHDQGLIPAKLLDRDRTVNVTVGLPIIRTSPDHGTAFDIAGRNQAEDGSMKAAIELAVTMASAPPLLSAFDADARRP